jgi:hypothetical protein
MAAAIRMSEFGVIVEPSAIVDRFDLRLLRTMAVLILATS